MSETAWNIEQLGPRQAKQAREVLAAITRELQTEVELTGTHGRPETEHRWALQHPFGGVANSPERLAILEKFRKEWNPITADKLHGFIAAAPAVLKALAELRPVTDKRITAEEEDARLARQAEQNRKMEETSNKAAECWRKLEALRPPNAQALIVAEEHIDDSDIMTDYHNYKTGRRVAIGWRTGSREDFRQLRQAAANFEPTADYGPGCDRYTVKSIWTEDKESNGFYIHKGQYYVHGELHGKRFTTRQAAEQAISEAPALGTCDGVPLAYTIETASVEHRENWSMGAGNFVGDSKYSGWIVRSYELGYSGYRSDVIETEYLEAIMQKQREDSTRPAAAIASAPGVTLSENEEKDGLEIRFDSKPPAKVLEYLKAHGWRWSRFSGCWYIKRSEHARNVAQVVVEGRVEQGGGAQ